MAPPSFLFSSKINTKFLKDMLCLKYDEALCRFSSQGIHLADKSSYDVYEIFINAKDFDFVNIQGDFQDRVNIARMQAILDNLYQLGIENVDLNAQAFNIEIIGKKAPLSCQHSIFYRPTRYTRWESRESLKDKKEWVEWPELPKSDSTILAIYEINRKGEKALFEEILKGKTRKKRHSESIDFEEKTITFAEETAFESEQIKTLVFSGKNPTLSFNGDFNLIKKFKDLIQLTDSCKITLYENKWLEFHSILNNSSAKAWMPLREG